MDSARQSINCWGIVMTLFVSFSTLFNIFICGFVAGTLSVGAVFWYFFRDFIKEWINNKT